MPFTLRIGFNINELLSPNNKLKESKWIQGLQHPQNPFVFGSFHLYSIQIVLKSLDWFLKNKKSVFYVCHVKKPSYYDCLDSSVILKNFLLDCRKIIIMLFKPMVANENKVAAPNSIMKFEACT